MDCRIARLLLPFARPGSADLEAAERRALERHLTDCPDCRIELGADRALDRTLGRAIRAVAVPPDLKHRLQANLAVQRRGFYRRWSGRGLAAAAGFFLVGFLLHLAWQEAPETVVSDPVLETVEPEGPFHTPREVVDHFAGMGYRLHLPHELRDNWDFRRVSWAEVMIYDGKATPTLLFKKGAARAKVYLLARGEFDPARIALRAANDPRLRILGDPQKDACIAIVELNEHATLEDFLRANEGIA